jgi:hypothetical protein
MPWLHASYKEGERKKFQNRSPYFFAPKRHILFATKRHIDTNELITSGIFFFVPFVPFCGNAS